MQTKSKQILQKQEKKWENMGKIQIQVRRTRVFILHGLMCPWVQMQTTDIRIQDPTDPTHLCIKQEEARETQDYCESVLAGVIDSLQRHYMSLRELIRGHEEEAAAQVEISLQTLQVKMQEMRKRYAELNRLTQTDSDVHFLQVILSL